MASTYPTAIDNFSNPTATSLLTSPSHSGQHSDINDAVEAIETAIGTTAAPVLAKLASPTFTGTPAAPTAAGGTNTTQIATTAYVVTAGNSKADLVSPTFTGTPAAPTAAANTNTTQIATTAYVVANTNALIATDVKAMPLGWLTGTYVRCPISTSGVTTVVPTKDRSTFTAVFVPKGGAIDRVAIEVTTVGGAGSVVRIGLYADNNGAPSTLINDAGTVDTATATGFQTLTVSWTGLNAGLYWICAVAQVGTSPTLRAVSTVLSGFAPYRLTTTSNVPDQWQVQGQKSGALPSTYGSVTGLIAGPIVIVRAA